MNITLHDDLTVSVLLNGNYIVGSHNQLLSDMVTTSMGGMVEGTEGAMDGAVGMKDPILSSWIFVIGISLVSLAISVTIGILLAKRKIKKGFGLYED